MWKKLLVPMLVIPGRSALAHVQDGQDDLLQQLSHQLTAIHHLPITLLLLVVAALIIHRWRAANNDR